MPKTFSLQKINECRAQIRNHHGKMSNGELASQLGISKTLLQDMVREMKLSKPKPRRHSHHGKYFNVHVYENWLTGVQ